MDESELMEAPFRVTDLKQWVYCPRVLYYSMCLPGIRPVTYKMESGIAAGEEAARLEARRAARGSLRSYGIEEGRVSFDVPLASPHFGLRGVVDMVIWQGAPAEEKAFPVDYKLSRTAGQHFKLQLAAYGLLLEECYDCQVPRGFLYFIPLKKAEEVRFTQRLRGQLLSTLDAMHRMLGLEVMPEPAARRARCAACEFRLFCNDVL